MGIWIIVCIKKPSHHFLQTFRTLRMFKIVFRDSSLYPVELSFLSAMADQRKRWPHWLHYHFLQHDRNCCTSSKTAVVDIEAFRHLIMSQQRKENKKFARLLYITKNRKFSCVLHAHSQFLCSLARCDLANRGVLQRVQPRSAARIRQDISAASFCSCKLLRCNDECVLLPCFNAQPDIFAVMNCCVVALSLYSSDIVTWSANRKIYIQYILTWKFIFSAMTHKLRRVRVEEYAYYVNKLRPNVGLETGIWRQIVTSQTTYIKYKWPSYATELTPPHENFPRTPLHGTINKPPLREAYTVAFVKQPSCYALDIGKNKWYHQLNAQINIQNMIFPHMNWCLLSAIFCVVWHSPTFPTALCAGFTSNAACWLPRQR